MTPTHGWSFLFSRLALASLVEEVEELSRSRCCEEYRQAHSPLYQEHQHVSKELRLSSKKKGRADASDDVVEGVFVPMKRDKRSKGRAHLSHFQSVRVCSLQVERLSSSSPSRLDLHPRRDSPTRRSAIVKSVMPSLLVDPATEDVVRAQWLFCAADLEYTPTVTSGLMKASEERTRRRKGVSLIYKVAERLGL